VAHVRGGSQLPESGEKVLNTRYVLRRPAEIACLAVRDPGLSGCAAALRPCGALPLPTRLEIMSYGP
jgi:hypothetical protein